MAISLIILPLTISTDCITPIDFFIYFSQPFSQQPTLKQSARTARLMRYCRWLSFTLADVAFYRENDR